MKKKTLGTMYWIGTLLFFTTLPSIKDVYLWQGIVLTCLASGLIAIILPKYNKQYADFEEMRRVSQKVDVRAVWDKFFDCLIFAVLLGMSVGLTVIGIGIICVKYF